MGSWGLYSHKCAVDPGRRSSGRLRFFQIGQEKGEAALWDRLRREGQGKGHTLQSFAESSETCFMKRPSLPSYANHTSSPSSRGVPIYSTSALQDGRPGWALNGQAR